MKHIIVNMPRLEFMSLCALMCMACTCTGAAHAGSSAIRNAVAASMHAGEVTGWGVAVSDSHLAAVRGGFDSGSGLLVSFGIERAVYVNGNLVTSTSLNIPDIGQMNGEQASALAAATSTLSVVQNGPVNTFDPAALTQTTAGTVVQNSLNNQNIRTLTTLNTTVNTLDLFKSVNLQSTLQAALVNSLGH
ncbi:MAG: hypothetical protein ABI128_15080 [Rhodanobacter sp.]